MRAGKDWWVVLTFGAGLDAGAVDGRQSVLGLADYKQARTLADWADLAIRAGGDVVTSCELADFSGRIIWDSHVTPKWADVLGLPLRSGTYEWDEISEEMVQLSDRQVIELDYNSIARQVQGVQGVNPGRAREAAEA